MFCRWKHVCYMFDSHVSGIAWIIFENLDLFHTSNAAVENVIAEPAPELQ